MVCSRTVTFSSDAAIERAVAAVRPEMKIATDELTVFGELLVVLARQLDGAQQTVKRLTWVLTALTAFLVIEAVVRYFSH